MPDVDLVVEDAVATVRMQRPPVNALSSDMVRNLLGTFRNINGDDSVRCVVFTSGTKCFSAGADMKEVSEKATSEEDAVAASRARYEVHQQLQLAIMSMRQPVIAAIAGPAIGAGAILAACCDIRVADGTAKFGLPEINVGQLGGGRLLMRVLPQGKVRQMYLTGTPIDAEEAHRLGLVDVLCVNGEVDQTAIDLARVIAAKDLRALRLGKEALDRCEELSIREGGAVEEKLALRLAWTSEVW